MVLRIAVEMNDALHYKLCVFGVPIDGHTNGFSDNESVVRNATLPKSTLAKKHNSIACHKVRECRECVTSDTIRIAHESGKTNCANDAYDQLIRFVSKFGIPQMLISDNAGEELGEDWQRVRKDFHKVQQTTETYSPLEFHFHLPGKAEFNG